MKLSHTISVGLVSTLSLVFVLAFAPIASGQMTLADARGDFVAGTNEGDPGIIPATGTGEWRYLASDTVNPTDDPSLDVLSWLIVNQYYIKINAGGSANVVALNIFDLASDELGMHPSASYRPPPFVVSRWIAGPGESGTINIAGRVRKTDPGGGSGVTFDLFVDGNSVFTSTLTDTVGVAFNETATIAVGSTVDFVVGPNGDDAYDSTALKAAITRVPFTAFTPTVEATLGPLANDDNFAVGGTFTLGAGSDGIDPFTEDVVLRVGTFSTTISGFELGEVFDEVIGGVALKVEISPLGANTFKFEATGEGADLTGTEIPVTVKLAIGDDGGSTILETAEVIAQ
jgi:hypothetical protein